MNRTKVAEIAYEATRAYEKSLGGDALPWAKLAPWDREAVGQSVLAVQRRIPLVAADDADTSKRVAEAIFAATVRAARGLDE